MSRTFDLAGGFLIGAGLMFLADPISGARRRALVRDKAIRTMHHSNDFLNRAGRDLRNRARGSNAESDRHGIQLLAGVAGLLALTAAGTVLARGRQRLASVMTEPDYAHLV
jgi:hypothetical protein